MTTAIQTRRHAPAREALLKCRAKIQVLEAKLAMALSAKSRQTIYDEWERLAFGEDKLLAASLAETRQQRAERWLATRA